MQGDKTGQALERPKGDTDEFVRDKVALLQVYLFGFCQMVSYTFFKFIAKFVFIGIQTTLFGHSYE